jgi:CheY-like chemotaxis protein
MASGRVQQVRVLVIDGYRDGAESLRDLLEHYGHEVRLAFTGAEGLAAAREFLPDLILCELALPGTNGLEVCQALRAAPIAVTRTRIVCLTGILSPEYQSRARAAGFDTVVPKGDLPALLALLPPTSPGVGPPA